MADHLACRSRFFFQAEGGTRVFCLTGGLGHLYKRQVDRTGKFNILLGPVNKQQFTEMQFENKAVAFIESILTIYLVQPLEFNVILILSKGILQSTQLGQSNWSALGQSTWLFEQSNTTEVNQVIYES